MSSSRPLVSIVIPAYNLKFFEHTLNSAVQQDYRNLEIIICDDSAQDEIGRVCERVADDRVLYIKNPRNIGFSANFTQCFSKGRGEYVKFLNDDDVLHPTCVSRMVHEFDSHGDGLSLVTSRRVTINEQGERCQDISATTPLALVTSYMNGYDLGNLALMHSTNYIGEPSTVMFRKRDVEMADASLFMLNGIEYSCLADLSLWLRLLSKGDAVYIADPLSAFRRHAGQEQRKPAVELKCLTDRFHIIAAAVKLGFLKTPESYKQAMRAMAGRLKMYLFNDYFDAEARKQLAELWQQIPDEFRP
jgi:glycosyltransferase involved in cell wall biosynthesis